VEGPGKRVDVFGKMLPLFSPNVSEKICTLQGACLLKLRAEKRILKGRSDRLSPKRSNDEIITIFFVEKDPAVIRICSMYVLKVGRKNLRSSRVLVGAQILRRNL